MTGFLAPDFTLTDITGNPVQLLALRGQPVIVNFWATWCPPCRAEMPAFEQLWQQYNRGDVMVLGVNQAESVSAVRRFEQEVVDMTFPILFDTNAEVSNLYGVRALPTTLFVDASGRIQDVKMGGMDRASLMDGVNRIVGR
jgi:peroxiredoxin